MGKSGKPVVLVTGAGQGVGCAACIRPGTIKTSMTETAGVTNPVENSRFEKSFAAFVQQLVDQMPKNIEGLTGFHPPGVLPS